MSSYEFCKTFTNTYFEDICKRLFLGKALNQVFEVILVEVIRSISPYSVRMRENAEQNNSEHRHILRRKRGEGYNGLIKFDRNSILNLKRLSSTK